MFRLWLGATEYLFRQPGLLDETLQAAIEDKTFRSDDLEFTFAARVSHPFHLPSSIPRPYRPLSPSFRYKVCVLFYQSRNKPFQRLIILILQRF